MVIHLLHLHDDGVVDDDQNDQIQVGKLNDHLDYNDFVCVYVDSYVH